MTHGSLFSGIGGFDLAAQWMGWTNVFHCEIEPFPQAILKHYWPNAISYGDIKQTDFTIHRGNIDVLSGGFPCQPFSMAGKRKGKADARHLWPEYARVIREIQPRWVVGENVGGLLSWNGGLVLDEVYADLESAGYEVWTVVLPACAIGAPHRRDRVWVVAYKSSEGLEGGARTSVQGRGNRPTVSHRPAPDTEGERRECKQARTTEFQPQAGQVLYGRGGYGSSQCWANFPTQSPICGRDDGLPTELDGITFSKWRNESIKGYGNAIVPQLAHEIFKFIEQTELV